MSTMKALVLTRYGGPEVLEIRSVTKPSPQPGEVLIRVHAAGLNPIDYKIRQGMMKRLHRYSLPIIAGNELSGVVESIGTGVTRFAAGDRVFTRVEKNKLGAFAEFAVVREELIAKMPASIDFIAAAGVPLAGLTALQALRDELQVKSGQSIFISGGSGGVGSFAIQIGKLFGARIATTASSQSEESVRRLGADIVVDYKGEEFDHILHGYDGALDLIGGETLLKTFKIMRTHGKVVSIAGIPEPQTAKKDLNGGTVLSVIFWIISRKVRRRASKFGAKYRYFFMHPSGADLSVLTEYIDDKKLVVIIDRVFPFEQIAEALAYLEQGHAKGKVIIQIVGE